MRKLLLVLLITIPCWMVQARDRQQERAAREVIERQLTANEPEMKVRVIIDGEGQSYSYKMRHGQLTIKATSGVAACRGFYDFIRNTEAGINTWNYSRLELPSKLKDTVAECKSPFDHFTYMNVVTFGYSCPFWDEARWDKEIDWMALHGIDMPLVLIGAEQVYREVFYDMGLTKEEVDAWEVGPAHLPWFRMGNLSGNSFDGPLGEDWNRRQSEICRHVLSKMRSLGMEPICPAFGGFVPPAMASRCHTDTTGWDWMPKDYRNYRIKPSSTEFVEIGRRFIEKWEQKYGKGKYYISDSFNEMEVPTDTTTLTQYGDSVFRSITAANPEAVWVTQGWTFVWQYGQWGKERFEALTRNIPNDKMLVLYMSPEYDPARYYGHDDQPCYKNYNGFAGKQWAYTLLPNMGGKNYYTGELAHYGWDFAIEARKNAQYYGITAEGIENNELLYELICDAGWGHTAQDISTWMRHYSRCRYGCTAPIIDEYLDMLLTTLYSRYTDHPRFGWQNGAVLTHLGTAAPDSSYYSGLEAIMGRYREMPSSPALEIDLAEAAAFYLGGKVDTYGQELNNILQSSPTPTAIAKTEHLLKKINHAMMMLDSIIAIHPQSLETWEQQATALAGNEQNKLRNARNARRIVTIWYGNHTYNEPVQDYAAKIWAGLVRDYYRPRLLGAWSNRIAEWKGEPQTFDQTAFENGFVNNAPKLTPAPKLPADRLSMIARAISTCETADKDGSIR